MPILNLNQAEQPTGLLQLDKPVDPPSTAEVRMGRAVPKNNNSVFDTWKSDPTPDNGAALFNHLQPYIESAVKRHAGTSSPVMISEAKSLLIDALPRYDGRSSLATFVDRQTMPLKRWGAQHRVGVKMPVSYSAQSRQIKEATSDLEDTLGRAPSQAELADRTGISLERLAKLSSVNVPIVSERVLAQEDQDGYTEAGDQPVEDDMQLALKSVYYSLNPVNQVIFEHTLGFNGVKKLTNQAIARKLHLTPGAVSQRKLKIQQMLDGSR